MTSRTRNRRIGEFSGYATCNGVTQSRSSFLYDEVCADVIGNYPNDNPLTITERDGYVCTISGQCAGYTYSQWPIVTGMPTSHIQKGLTLDAFVPKLMAQTNPASASFSLPVAIGELRDLPSLLKAAHGNISRKAAGSYLNYEFGWKPFLSDCRKMLSLVSLIERKLEELKRLSQGSIRTSSSLGTEEFTSSVSKGKTLNSTLATIITSDYYDVTVRQTWGVCTWKPSVTIPEYLLRDARSIRALATKLALGTHSSQQLVNAWNLCPWTWLVDWFTGVSDFLESNNNSIAYASGPVCIMQTATTTRVFLNSKFPSGITHTKLTSEYVTKRRQLFSPTPAVKLRPFLTKRMSLILGSLAILKGR